MFETTRAFAYNLLERKKIDCDNPKAFWVEINALKLLLVPKKKNWERRF